MSRPASSDASVAVDPGAPPRYVVGIDLGTTNCAVASVDTQQVSRSGDFPISTYLIPQWVDWGQFERLATLPSFHYETPADATEKPILGRPWAEPVDAKTADGDTAEPDKPNFVVGTLARDAGMRQPGRRVASAKSWLSHAGVDRSAPLLPWRGDADVSRHSPVEISARYLAHIREAWDAEHPDEPLAQQDVVITLPASFDEVGRELTVAAARRAGLPRVFLIEEPQAAFYAWIHRHREDWRQRVSPGQLILVCDIGGGTTDFTLIRVRPTGDSGGEVQFHRVAVGKHLILGGDNLDLALATGLEAKTAGDSGGAEPASLPPRQWDRLVQACRGAKEKLLGEPRPESLTLSIAGDSARLLATGWTTTVTAADCDRLLVDGFFPEVPLDAHPASDVGGFREFGLPYAQDPAITRHLAEFLATHVRAGLAEDDPIDAARPDWVLFNGGVMSSPILRQRLLDSVRDWFANGSSWQPQELVSDQLDLAVAHGAAYFGMVRRGLGVRIAANLGRSYFLQVADEPPETTCLVPGNAQPGNRYSSDQSLRLSLGVPVQFPLWVSSTRLTDAPGDRVAIDRGELTPLPPIRTVMVRGRSKSAGEIDVRMEAELSEIGTLGLYCVEENGGKRWRLEFDVRSTLQTDRAAHAGSGESHGIVDLELQSRCNELIRQTFLPPGSGVTVDAPGPLIKKLKAASGLDRDHWPPSLLRGMWQALIETSEGRRRSAAHETRWLNLTGYCLRPGYGMAVDDWRVGEVWRRIHGKLAFAAAGSRTESLILWRRIAGGLTAGQQAELIAPWLATLKGKATLNAPHEVAEWWRMVGALERLPSHTKAMLAETALALVETKKSAPHRDALLWAIGRLASRQPLYGPLNTVVDVGPAAAIVKRIIRGTDNAVARQLALMQIARRTGDRYRELSPELRDRVADWLQATEAPQRYLRAVLEGGDWDTEDSAAIFGESLPLGIRLTDG